MYKKLSNEIENKILNIQDKNVLSPYAFCDKDAVRANDKEHDRPNAVRSNFIKDIDKIMNCPYFSRYEDKTQVFSLYKNDDISHRSLHVQLVSRIARTIGKALNLNLELIEAIALGHDIGHTPFGHAGEHVLDKLYYEKTSRHFYHNVQSVRVLTKIFPYNLTLQTLDGILCHNGELELDMYSPQRLENFAEFNEKLEKCYTENGYMQTLVPSTMEACVVRVSDIIAYLGKDRQDAEKTKTAFENDFVDNVIGSINAEIINNLTINIIENSFGKPYIKMEKEYFDALKKAKNDNYQKIYFSDSIKGETDKFLFPLMSKMYDRFLLDLKNKNTDSLIYRHHVNYINKCHYSREDDYLNTEENQIVVDYIASMTDDYFIDVYKKLFPLDDIKIKYNEYFD